MFERFTDRNRRVIVLAQEESRLAGQPYIGTEHILLGLIAEGEAIAAQVLAASGVTADAVRGWLAQIIEPGTGAPAGHIPFTPRTKKVLELSLREALQLGHNYVGTEHTLLALIREGEGVAAQTLTGLGVDLAQLRRAIIGAIAGGEPATVDNRQALIRQAVRQVRALLDVIDELVSAETTP